MNIAPRAWLDVEIIKAFPSFISESINDMDDKEIEQLYQLIKKYKHRLLKQNHAAIMHNQPKGSGGSSE
jgi:hypothetical protein